MVQSTSPLIDTDTYPCHCRVCETSRAYQKEHHVEHAQTVRRYYGRNRENILMQKAYKRLLTGTTKKLHKATIQRLINAGYDVPRTAVPLDMGGEFKAPTVSLSAFTSIEVS